MIVLDENVPDHQRRQLQSWRIRNRQIGQEIAALGTQDLDLIRLLHRTTLPTFFSLDRHFYNRNLRHGRYCLVFVDVEAYQAAAFVRRFLRHPEFATFAARRGTVVRLDYGAIHLWRLNSAIEETIFWP